MNTQPLYENYGFDGYPRATTPNRGWRSSTSRTLLRHHGQGSPQLPLEQLHIPVFVWLSDRYIERYPAVFENLSRNRTKRLFAGNSLYTVADLGGIQFKKMQPEFSIANDRFVPVEHRDVYFDANAIQID